MTDCYGALQIGGSPDAEDGGVLPVQRAIFFRKFKSRFQRFRENDEVLGQDFKTRCDQDSINSWDEIPGMRSIPGNNQVNYIRQVLGKITIAKRFLKTLNKIKIILNFNLLILPIYSNFYVATE